MSGSHNIQYKKRYLPSDTPLLTNKDTYHAVEIIDFFQWANFEGKDINIIRTTDSEGKPCKKFDYTSPNANSYEIYLPNDWYCIDIDVWCQYYPSFVQTLPFTISSSKKRHYYCRINTDVFKELGTKQPINVLDFEISKEEQQFNKCDRGYGDILKKMWEPKDGFLYFPKGMENLQNSFFKISFTRILPYLKIPQTTLKEEALKFDDISSNTQDEPKESCYKKLLQILGRDWYEPYDNWNKVLWCLPQTEECRVLFHEWSKRCLSKYDQHSIDSKWNQIRDRNQFGFQTLLKYCRIESPEETTKLELEFKSNKQSEEQKIIYEFNATNIAKYFKQSCPFGYIFHKNWYELNQHGIWIEADGKIPYQLRTEMYEYVLKKLVEFSLSIVKDTTLTEDKRKEILGKICDAKRKLGDTTLKDKVIKELEELYLDREIFRKLNQNRTLWAFNNCLVDLSTGIKRKIEPNDYISITCGYNYPEHNEENKVKALAHLQTMFKTQEELLFCLRCMASCLRGQNLFDKWFIFKGKGGNGKGCFFDAMMKVFGQYWGIMPVEYFYTTTRKDPTRPDTTAVASLYKRVLYSSEALDTDEDDQNSSKLDIATIKKWTGKEQIKCRDLFSKTKEMLEFEPYGTLLWNTNDIPSIPIKDKQNSDALKRRLVIHEFPFTFYESESDIQKPEIHRIGNPMVKLELQNEKMRNAIMLILLETYDVHIKGQSSIAIPTETKANTNSFLSKENDIIKQFMENYYESADEKETVKRDCIFMNFKGSNEYSECKLKASAFYDILEKVGYVSKRLTNGTRVFQSIKEKDLYKDHKDE
jgi:phage/plasmid-associated DNA primase